MSTPRAAESQSVPLEGRLGDPAILPRLYAWLARGEWTGMVMVRAGDVERRVYFVEGRVSTAGSSDPAESLAQSLIREGLLTEEERSRAAGQLRATDRGWSFGRQLVRSGMLQERDLLRVERRRVIVLVEATLGLRTGTYACESGTLAGDAQPQQTLEVPRLVAEGVLTFWDANSALEVLGGRDALIELLPEHLPELEATGAEEAYDYTLLLCNGQRNVEQILALAPLPEAASLRFLAALRLLDVVATRPASRQAASPPMAAAAAASGMGGAGMGDVAGEWDATSEAHVADADRVSEADIPARLRTSAPSSGESTLPGRLEARSSPSAEGSPMSPSPGSTAGGGHGSETRGAPAATGAPAASGAPAAGGAPAAKTSSPSGTGAGAKAAPAAPAPAPKARVSPGRKPAPAVAGDAPTSRTAWIVFVIVVLLAATAFFAWIGWREFSTPPAPASPAVGATQAGQPHAPALTGTTAPAMPPPEAATLAPASEEVASPGAAEESSLPPVEPTEGDRPAADSAPGNAGSAPAGSGEVP